MDDSMPNDCLERILDGNVMYTNECTNIEGQFDVYYVLNIHKWFFKDIMWR